MLNLEWKRKNDTQMVVYDVDTKRVLGHVSGFEGTHNGYVNRHGGESEPEICVGEFVEPEAAMKAVEKYLQESKGRHE